MTDDIFDQASRIARAAWSPLIPTPAERVRAYVARFIGPVWAEASFVEFPFPSYLLSGPATVWLGFMTYLDGDLFRVCMRSLMVIERDGLYEIVTAVPHNT